VKNGSRLRVCQVFIGLKKAYDSVRRELLYNILIEFAVPITFFFFIYLKDRPCGIMVRVPGYRSRSAGLDSLRYKML
jgi:hypothetical protein